MATIKIPIRADSSAQALVENPSLTKGEKLRRFTQVSRNSLKSLSNRIEKSSRYLEPLTSGKKQIGGSTQKRATATQNLLTQVGALPSGRGRPKQSYKYGMPIQDYKKLQKQKLALYKQYSQAQQQQLAQRGFTPQQIKMLQLNRTQSQAQIPVPDAAKDELEFQRYLAQNTVTPRTQAILDRLKRIQNKAQTDDINQQRIHRERKLVNEQQSLLKARNLFGQDSNKINIFDDTYNPLKAENMFAEGKQQNVFAPSGRPTLLQTNIAGNSIHAFDSGSNILNGGNIFSAERSQQHRLQFF